MIRNNGVLYFGYFKGMEYTKYSNRELEDDFEMYRKFKNAIPKNRIIRHIEDNLQPGLACMQTFDIYTGEELVAGQYTDGAFAFPTDFLHYLKNYDIGIPYEYEEYLKGIIDS